MPKRRSGFGKKAVRSAKSGVEAGALKAIFGIAAALTVGVIYMAWDTLKNS
jgi:hypothetical protein